MLVAKPLFRLLRYVYIHQNQTRRDSILPKIPDIQHYWRVQVQQTFYGVFLLPLP